MAPPQMAGPSSSTHSSPQRDNRESNALRASVLDAALELGLANNGTVAKWMFSNAIDEEDEEEEYPSPGLTYGSTSEDSPAHTSVEHSQSIDQLLKDNFSSFSPLDPAVPHSASGVMIPPIPSIPEGLTPPEKGPKKLLKKKGAFGFSIDNGYESDGGYVSEGGKKTKKKKKEKTSDDLSMEKKRLKEEKREEKQREKDAKKAAKKEAGYETDGSPAISLPKRTKTKKQKDASPNGYETDDGYLSSTTQAKKKNKFFRLGNRSKGDLSDPVPPLPQQPIPALPPMPLPIAEQFATTLAGGNKSPPQQSTTTASLRSNTLESSIEGGYVPGSEDSNHNNQFSGGAPLARTLSPDSTDSSPSGSAAPNKRAALVRFRDTALTIPDAIGPISSNVIAPTSTQTPSSLSSSSSRSLSPIPPSINRSISPTSPLPPASRPVSPYQSHPYAQRLHDIDERHIPTPLTLPSGLSTNTVLASPNRAVSPLPVSPRPAIAVADELMPPSNSYRQGRLQSGRNAPSPLEILTASELNAFSSSSNAATSPLAPPNRTRLAFHDTPPPSPPPDAPLPNVPASLQIMQQQQQRAMSPAPSPSPGAPQQRGKIAPFPTKPRTRPNEAPPPRIEAKIRVRRYRDVFGVPCTPTGGWQTNDPPSPVEREGPQHQPQISYDEAPGIQVLEPSDDEADGDGQEILGVIQRWRYDEGAEAGGASGNMRFKESAVGRRRSVDIVQNIRINSSTMIRDAPDAPESVYADDDDDRSLYPDDDQTAGRLTMYSVENGGSNTQSVRWSSVSADDVDEYSRRSLIDGAKSQRLRDVFVRRVEATFDESGREKVARGQRNATGGDANNANPSVRKREAIPPVPKIPEGWF